MLALPIAVLPLGALIALHLPEDSDFCAICQLEGSWFYLGPGFEWTVDRIDAVCVNNANTEPELHFFVDEARLGAEGAALVASRSRILFDEHLQHEVYTFSETHFQTAEDGWPSHALSFEVIGGDGVYRDLLTIAGPEIATGSYTRCSVGGT